MRRKADTGIQVTTHVAKDMYAKNKQSLFSVIYQLIFLILAAYGTIFSGITGLDITVNEKVITGIIIVAGILFGLCFMYIKKIYYVMLPVLVGILGIALFVHKSLIDGMQRIYNIFIVSYNSYYSTELTPFQIDNMTSTKNTTLFISLISIVFIMLIAYCLLRSRQAIFYLFITVPFIFVPYMVGQLPKAAPFYWYIISTFIMLTPILAFGKGAFKNYEIRFKLNIIMTVLTLSVFMIGYLQITPKRYETMNVGALKKSVQTSVQTYSMDSIFHTNPLQVLLTKSHSASGGMSGGTLGESSSLHFTNKTMLEVKLEKNTSSPLYIKGYVGQVYDHNEWNTLEGKDKREFDSLNQEYENRRMNTEGLSKEFTEMSYLYDKTNTISIKNVGNSTNASFVPYSAADLCEIGDNGYLKWKGSDLGYLEYKTNYWMLKGYVPGTIGSPSNQKIMARNLIAKELLNSAMKKYMLESTFGQSIDIIKQEGDVYDNGQYEIDNHITDMPAIREWIDKYSELESCATIQEDNMKSALTAASKFSNYIEFESKAEQLIYKTYTKLPNDSLGQVKKLVRGWYKPSRVLLNTHDETLNYAFHQFDQYDRYSDYVKAIAKVKDYLATHTKYSLKPGELPKGEDFVENFLFEKKKGYCMHYASAATVMFRAMGIPARYVEGYIVTKSDMDSANKKTGAIRIKDKNAHSWTEIYLDGYGWVPVEVTPAYERNDGKEIPVEITHKLPKGTMGKEQSLPKVTVRPNVKPTKKPITDNENLDHGNKGKAHSNLEIHLPNWALYVIKVIALSVMTIILIIFVIKTRIFIIKKRRRKWAMDGDNSRRLLAQYHLFEKTMKEYQIQYESTTSVDTLYNECIMMFPEIEKNDLRRYINLALKAKYNCERVSNEETANADSLYRKFMMQIGSNSKKTKRLFLRYIKVLEV